MVTNPGTAGIPDPITIADDIATNETCPSTTTIGNGDGVLDPGETLTCSATNSLSQPDIDAGSVTNVASASGTDPNGDPVDSPEDTETVDAEQNPALSLDKTGVLDAGKRHAVLGRAIRIFLFPKLVALAHPGEA